MTLLWIDGFDTYSLNSDLTRNNYNFVNVPADGTPVIATVNPRTGPACLTCANNNGMGIVKNLANKQKIAAGMAFYPTADARYHGSIFIGAGATEAVGPVGPGGAGMHGIQFARDAGGGFIIGQSTGGANAVIYTSVVTPFALNVYSYVELVVDIATGSCDVWFNGTQHLLNLTGLTLPANLNQVAWGQPNAVGAGLTFDDIYVTDGNLLGAQRAYPLFVNADQLPQDWTRSAGGVSFSLIDQRVYNTANFIEGTAVAQNAKFGCDDLPMTNAVINGIRLNSIQQLDLAGSAAAVQKAFIGANEYDGAASAPSTSANYVNDIFSLNGVSVNDINGMSLEITRTA